MQVVTNKGCTILGNIHCVRNIDMVLLALQYSKSKATKSIAYHNICNYISGVYNVKQHF